MKKGHQPQSKRCLVCVTNGSEDTETVTVVDTLRRYRQIDVVLAKVLSDDAYEAPPDLKNQLQCKLMQGINIVSKYFH